MKFYNLLSKEKSRDCFRIILAAPRVTSIDVFLIHPMKLKIHEANVIRLIWHYISVTINKTNFITIHGTLKFPPL